MTKEEHVHWCKQRAIEYLNRGDVANAITSMLSDMRKHPETKMNSALEMFALGVAIRDDATDARRFIEGFN
jgi:hypothetical protein